MKKFISITLALFVAFGILLSGSVVSYAHHGRGNGHNGHGGCYQNGQNCVYNSNDCPYFDGQRKS